ncbi:uridine kinase [Clostridia bacterium]|nr:uridine kinase [Clostridia bacterium]
MHYQDEDKRVYERSVRLMFLAAAHIVCPDARVRIEHSVHYGVFARLSQPIDAFTVARIEREMRGWVDKNEPIQRRELNQSELLAWLLDRKDDAAYRLLSKNPLNHTRVFSIGGYEDYLFGDCVDSAGELTCFRLKSYSFGAVIQLPAMSTVDGESRLALLPWNEQPKYMKTFGEAARWARILNCRSVADLNDMVRGGSIRDFVWVSEALHEKSIADIADKIARKSARVIMVAGPSSSGKTTFTHRLAIQLRVIGKRPIILSLDNYYKKRDDIPFDSDGSRDLESLDAIQVDLFNEHLAKLLSGEAVEIPHYDFKIGDHKPEKSQCVRLDGNQPILIEGIHGLNPRITESISNSLCFRIYISALTAINLDPHNRMRTTDTRLIRRIVRDFKFRSSPIEHTFSMWSGVRRGEERWIFPYQETADVSFNSALPYELTVLKGYALPLLLNVEADSPYKPLAGRLVELLNFVESANVEADIAPTSLLREFIGGCAFYMKPKSDANVD